MPRDASEKPRPAYVAARQAAAMLDVSTAFFRHRVAPQIPSVDLAPKGSRKRLPRWRVDALMDWAASQDRAA